MEPGFWEVVEVTPQDLPRVGGMDWNDLRAEASSDNSALTLREVRRGTATGCPQGKAWLREHDKRAFMFYQNW